VDEDVRDLVREHLLEAAVRVRRRALGQKDDDVRDAVRVPRHPRRHGARERRRLRREDDADVRPWRIEAHQLHHARDPWTRPGGEAVRGRSEAGLGLDDETCGFSRREGRSGEETGQDQALRDDD
jgi:hypothetical protein